MLECRAICARRNVNSMYAFKVYVMYSSKRNIIIKKAKCTSCNCAKNHVSSGWQKTTQCNNCIFIWKNVCILCIVGTAKKMVKLFITRLLSASEVFIDT